MEVYFIESDCEAREKNSFVKCVRKAKLNWCEWIHFFSLFFFTLVFLWLSQVSSNVCDLWISSSSSTSSILLWGLIEKLSIITFLFHSYLKHIHFVPSRIPSCQFFFFHFKQWKCLHSFTCPFTVFIFNFSPIYRVSIVLSLSPSLSFSLAHSLVSLLFFN